MLQYTFITKHSISLTLTSPGYSTDKKKQLLALRSGTCNCLSLHKYAPKIARALLELLCLWCFQSKFCWDLSICNSLTCHCSPHIDGDVRKRSSTIHPAFSGYALGYALSKGSSVFYGPCSQCLQGNRSGSLQWIDSALISFLCLNEILLVGVAHPLQVLPVVALCSFCA